MATLAFPAERVGQTYVSVSAIAAGYLCLDNTDLFEDARINCTPGGIRSPSFAFLIQHPTQGKLIFDLGLRKQGQGYPPALDIDSFAIECDEDIVDKLCTGGISPAEIDTVIYRQDHLHFDHVGDLTPFQHTVLVMSADAKPLVAAAARNPATTKIQAISEDQRVRYITFDGSVEDSTMGMPKSTLVSPLCDFDRALDLFSDGSLYIIDAPGHMPGHISALVRVAKDTFVLLAADCCHNRQCYDPTSTSSGMVRIISRDNYEDWELSKSTVAKLVDMSRRNLVVILAHEGEREMEMPMFPLTLNDWANDQVAKKLRASS
ncbi:beta-lactamase-like protein [Melanogaster broomeanus]|nr:beta-lactamase-like protein [Melanogaster broomeanus]